MNPTNVSVLTETIVSHSVLSNTVFLMGVEFLFMGKVTQLSLVLGLQQRFLMCNYSQNLRLIPAGISRSKVTRP